MTMRDRMIEQRREELVLPVTTRPVIRAVVDELVCVVLRSALADPAIPNEAKDLMRQSVAAMVAAWTPETSRPVRVPAEEPR